MWIQASLNREDLQYVIFLPGVPLIRFGIILVGGDEVNLSLHEIGEGMVVLPLEVEL